MVVMIGAVFASCTSDDSTEGIEESSNLVINRSSEREVILSLELSDEELTNQINEFRIVNEASIEEGGLIEISPIPNKRKAIMSIKNYDINDIETRIAICVSDANSGCVVWFFDRLREGCTQIGAGDIGNDVWVAFNCP